MVNRSLMKLLPVAIGEFLPKNTLTSCGITRISVNSIRFCSAVGIERITKDDIVDTERAEWEHHPPPAAESFQEEMKLRSELKGKLEKIKVHHKGHNRNITVEVNRNYSTPLDVARHVGLNYVQLSACALIGQGKYMDMNQPITEVENEIEMEFVWFKNSKHDPTAANKTLWNTTCLLTGSILSDVFRDYIEVYPWLPSVDLNCESGAFGYEFELVGQKNGQDIKWNADNDEIILLNRKLRSLIYSKPFIYGIDVTRAGAEKIFGKGSYKIEMVDQILTKFRESKQSVNKIRLYCCGDLVEIHPGPLLPSVGLLGQVEITAVYPLDCEGVNGGFVHRLEGVALPSVLPAHHWPWSVITQAAKEDARLERNGEPTLIEDFAQWYYDQYIWKTGL